MGNKGRSSLTQVCFPKLTFSRTLLVFLGSASFLSLSRSPLLQAAPEVCGELEISPSMVGGDPSSSWLSNFFRMKLSFFSVSELAPPGPGSPSSLDVL